MESFDKCMQDHQVRWRKANVSDPRCGRWRGCEYPWILPEGLWEEGLWPGIRTGSGNSLPAYLERTGVQKHEGVHNLKSSWVQCANLYFPFRESAESRALFASFLKFRVNSKIESLGAIELEYAEHEDSPLHPSPLLGEAGGTRGAYQTSPDLGLLVNGGRGLVLVENKLTEKNFSKCPERPSKGTHSDPCNQPVSNVSDHATQCRLSERGRRYWDHLAPVIDESSLAALRHCPAMTDGYQLFRQQALAEGMAQSGRYNPMVSAVAVDERNGDLDAALRPSGIDGLRQWTRLFKGRARFAMFTHQEWIGWVQRHDTEGMWSDWLSYVRARYCL